MTKRTRILAWLAAAVLAVGLAAVGFSTWQANVSVGGAVVAGGSWNLEITQMACDLSGGTWAELPNGETVPGPATDVQNATLSEDGLTGQFGTVHFGQSQTWASYTVVVTNTGNVTANLANWSLETSDLPSNIYHVKKPEFSAGDTLAPGESCAVTVVVEVNATAELDGAEAVPGSFNISLQYTQDEVETAPEAAYYHIG
ncbi:MAG: hypothetical protein SPG86_10305 [Gemmiger sp.]|uniref:hypothetical protein n=3 Tax=Gemmiger sp. TaxID=2049027 RepID=UPI002A91CB7E|nr:hypothetical protein [Gemmiger sp.]MCI6141036.1 hypothetical protein [Subdoligranulum variabile]MCI6384758.1 hypothetical protein [Subdoligranulum variabile]MDD6424404.1 hypothetical protein [Subdoligranulum variabile]MDY5411956.1 hypothetical protein [Gemmiger sp.]